MMDARRGDDELRDMEDAVVRQRLPRRILLLIRHHMPPSGVRRATNWSARSCSKYPRE
jgi:hypothetical protein